MSKQILGDNPFDDDDGSGDDGSGEGRDDRDSTEGGGESGDADDGDAEPAAADAEEGGGDRREPADGAGAPEDREPPAERPSRADTAVPDAVVSGPFHESDGGGFDDSEDMFLGGEAAVPPGDYGPPIPSVLPDSRSITTEIRELERRVRERLTPAFPIEQPRQLPLEFVWKRYRRLAMRNRSDVVDDYGRDPVYTARVERVLDVLTRRYFRLETSGIENVPANGRAILVANHAGPVPYDAAVLMHVLRRVHPTRRDLRPLVEDNVYHFPYLGKLLSRVGAVRACQENAERLLEEDEVIAVFPEGSQGTGKLFKNRYRLQRFGRGGFIKLALKTRAPVVPVAVVGSEEAQPVLARMTWLSSSFGLPYVPITPTFPFLGPLGLLPLPSKWRIQFGEPLDLAGEYGPSAADDRLLVNLLTSRVRSQIQSMLEGALTAPETDASG